MLECIERPAGATLSPLGKLESPVSANVDVRERWRNFRLPRGRLAPRARAQPCDESKQSDRQPLTQAAASTVLGARAKLDIARGTTNEAAEGLPFASGAMVMCKSRLSSVESGRARRRSLILDLRDLAYFKGGVVRRLGRFCGDTLPRPDGGRLSRDVSRDNASRRSRSCERCVSAVTTRTLSRSNWRPARMLRRCLMSTGSSGPSRSQRSSTVVATLVGIWPPGPEARTELAAEEPGWLLSA